MEKNNFDFSIIICTHNPEIDIIKRCLSAVRDLARNKISAEVIVVENNCSFSLNDLPELKSIIEVIEHVKIIEESKPGLSNARIAGFNASVGKWLLFFDDDNEPDPNYLINLTKLINEIPYVGIWGPGNVTVDFLGTPEKWVKENCLEVFQEKHFDKTEFALQQKWNTCYPPGTGMAVCRTVFEKYSFIYTSRKIKTTDRTGSSLISAGDNQIVYSAIMLNFPIGTSPKLSVSHLISEKKSNFNYVKRLRFFVRYSVPFAEIEFYPEEAVAYQKKIISQFALFILLMKYLVKGVLKFKTKEAIINCVLVTGSYTGINYALKKKDPFWLLIFFAKYK